MVLLIRTACAALMRGKATRVPEHPKTLLVVLTGKLGDIVCGTPVLRAIRAHLPATRLIVAGGGPLRALLADSGLADEYLDAEAPDFESRARSCHADAALIAGPSFATAACAYLAGIPLVVVPDVQGGYSPAETKPYRFLKRLVRTFPYRMREYAPRERLRVLEPFGIVSDDTQKRLGFSEADDRKAIQFLIENGIDGKKDFIVGISPSAGHKIKEWPTERFSTVADYLIEMYGAKIVLFSSKSEEARARAFLTHAKHAAAIVNSQGKFDIGGLKALIAKLNLFISVDTGPIYIAEAFGIPTIDITGPIDENEQPPIGPRHMVVVPPERKRPELFVLNARQYNAQEARRQVESITVEAVTIVINQMILLLREQHGTRT